MLDLDADLTFDECFMHTTMTATLLDDEGRTTTMTARQGADLPWSDSTELWIHEAARHTTVDGIDGVGYIECAWPPAYLAHHRTDDAPQSQRT